MNVHFAVSSDYATRSFSDYAIRPIMASEYPMWGLDDYEYENAFQEIYDILKDEDIYEDNAVLHAVSMITVFHWTRWRLIWV